MTKNIWIKVMAIVVLTMVVGTSSLSFADEGKRVVKSRGKITYPELAHKMNVSGTVRVEVVVGANGAVKSAKALGGHPLLIESALSAAKQYKYEPGAESTETISFDFNPSGN